MVERSACWHCDREATETSLEFDSVLMSRTAREGGPVLVWDCPGCGRRNVVERNDAEEKLLVPPSLLGLKAAGARAAKERRWAAQNAARRRDFHSRTAPARPAVSAESPPPRAKERDAESAPEPTPEPEPEPADEPDLAEEPDPREISSLLEAYEVLDLPLTASADEIRKRFRDLVKKCHPDRVAGLDEAIRKAAERRFREIRRAYDLLSGE